MASVSSQPQLYETAPRRPFNGPGQQIINARADTITYAALAASSLDMVYGKAARPYSNLPEHERVAALAAENKTSIDTMRSGEFAFFYIGDDQSMNISSSLATAYAEDSTDPNTALMSHIKHIPKTRGQTDFAACRAFELRVRPAGIVLPPGSDQDRHNKTTCLVGGTAQINWISPWRPGIHALLCLWAPSPDQIEKGSALPSAQNMERPVFWLKPFDARAHDLQYWPSVVVAIDILLGQMATHLSADGTKNTVFTPQLITKPNEYAGLIGNSPTNTYPPQAYVNAIFHILEGVLDILLTIRALPGIAASLGNPQEVPTLIVPATPAPLAAGVVRVAINSRKTESLWLLGNAIAHPNGPAGILVEEHFKAVYHRSLHNVRTVVDHQSTQCCRTLNSPTKGNDVRIVLTSKNACM